MRSGKYEESDRDVDTVITAQPVLPVRIFPVQDVDPLQVGVPATGHRLQRTAGLTRKLQGGRLFLLAGLSCPPLSLLRREEALLRHLAQRWGHPVQAAYVVDAGVAGEAEGVGVLVPCVEAGVSQAVGGGAGGEACQVEGPL